MKNIYLNNVRLVVISSLIMFVLFACSQADDNTINTRKQTDLSIEFENIPAEYAEIGVEPNNGLEYAFNSIKNDYLIASRSGNKVKRTKEDVIAADAGGAAAGYIGGAIVGYAGAGVGAIPGAVESGILGGNLSSI